MIDETNLSGRDLLANPVRGDLVHAQGKDRHISLFESTRKSRVTVFAPLVTITIPTLSERILLCPA